MNTDYKQKILKEFQEYYSSDRRYDRDHPSIMKVILPYISDDDFENSKKVVDEVFNLCLLTLRKPYIQMIPCFGFMDIDLKYGMEGGPAINNKINVIHYFLEKIIDSYDQRMNENPTKEMFHGMVALQVRIKQMYMTYNSATNNTNEIDPEVIKVFYVLYTELIYKIAKFSRVM